MAEVKLKNGYLRISVSLFENLYFRNFSKHEIQIISLILRLSYGYQKKTAFIKPKNWFSVCGIPRQDIFKTLRELVAKNVVKDLGNNTYSLNKNYDEWLVNYNKNFDEEKLNILKIFQNGRKTRPQEVGKRDRKKSENATENGSETRLETVAKHDQINAESQDGASDINGSKDNKDNKDNTNNIYNNKHFDPYFNNPVVDKFKKEYERIFKTTRCYLDAIQINKLTEIGIDNPDFINKIPEILEKYKRIEFSNGINKFNLRGLINEGKWAAILNGEYDPYIKPEENSAEFDLGIPTAR